MPGWTFRSKRPAFALLIGQAKVIREVKVTSEPGAILVVLADEAFAIKRIGLEAGPLSQWLYSALAEAGLPVICVETRHMKAALSAQINKSDRNDARGIAHMMRVGLYRPVHVKTLGQPEATDAADQPPAAARQGARHRERSARHAAQLRPQGRHGQHGQVRGPDPRARRGAIRTWPPLPTVADRSAVSCASNSACFIASCSLSYATTRSAVD